MVSIATNHASLFNGWMLQQHRFDLCQLNAVSTPFDLLVAAAEVDKLATGELFTQIARAVEATRPKRIGDKALSREGIAVEVAPRNPPTSHDDFADLSRRHRLEISVKQMDLSPWQRSADRRALGPGEVSATDGTQRQVHRRFSDAIHVDQLGLAIAVLLQPAREKSDRQRFTAEDDVAQ